MPLPPTDCCQPSSCGALRKILRRNKYAVYAAPTPISINHRQPTSTSPSVCSAHRSRTCWLCLLATPPPLVAVSGGGGPSLQWDRFCRTWFSTVSCNPSSALQVVTHHPHSAELLLFRDVMCGAMPSLSFKILTTSWHSENFPPEKVGV